MAHRTLGYAVHAARTLLAATALQSPRSLMSTSSQINALKAAALVAGVRGESSSSARIARGALAPMSLEAAASSIASARNAFPEFTFLCEDVANLPDLSLGAPFDLIIAINTLHATGIDMARTLRHLVSERLTTKGGLLLGLPNSRHRSTSLTYGTQAKNRRGAELTPVVKDAMFIRRYMNQHRFDVRILGKHNVLIAGRRGGSKSP